MQPQATTVGVKLDQPTRDRLKRVAHAAERTPQRLDVPRGHRHFAVGAPTTTRNPKRSSSRKMMGWPLPLSPAALSERTCATAPKLNQATFVEMLRLGPKYTAVP